jgi:hypothetical protein
MKKIFITPKYKFVLFKEQDVLTTSYGDPYFDNETPIFPV